MLVVQFDGVGRPVLEGALRAGHMPNVDRMLRDGDSALHSWRAQLPATTPASQAGILHGRGDAIPGFRWYEKATARLMVANHAEDASTIEARVTTARACWPTAARASATSWPGTRPRAT